MRITDMHTPNESSESSPPADTGRVVLPLPDPWRFAYERISEGHMAAVLNQQQQPGNEEAKALLHATSAAVRAFREVYEKTRMIGLAAQIGEMKNAAVGIQEPEREALREIFPEVNKKPGRSKEATPDKGAWSRLKNWFFNA